MMIARRCCCSAISVLFQKTRPRSVLVSHKQKNSSLLSSIDRSHFFVFIFFFFFERFFFVSKPRRLLRVAKAKVLFFSSFQEKLLRRMRCFVMFVCSRPPKKKIFRLKICPRGHPSSPRQPRIQNQRRCVLWHKTLLHKNPKP